MIILIIVGATLFMFGMIWFAVTDSSSWLPTAAAFTGLFLLLGATMFVRINEPVHLPEVAKTMNCQCVCPAEKE